MNLSYWELDTYFKNLDFVVIGSGIVGLSTAFHLRQKHPKAKILILEKGKLPEGASTKNAGFACFGGISEILSYQKTQSQQEIYNLVERRYKGLQKLRNLLGDESMDFHPLGGYELFRESDRELMHVCLDEMDHINQWLQPIFKQDVFKSSEKDFGFEGIIGNIETELEGQIHTGKMMRSFVKMVVSHDISILNSLEVTHLDELNTSVELELNHEFTIKCSKVFLCTNAFTKKLYDLDVVPARAQVLITKPIENLKVIGNFHMNEGFYYFRNTGNRILFGGGRNLDIEGETTSEFGITNAIQNQLETYLREIILPSQEFEIEHRWSGIMAMGADRTPIVKQLSDNVYCGVKLTGTGIAIGSLVGEELADLTE